MVPLVLRPRRVDLIVIALHVVLLASVVAGTAACLVARGGRSRRPLWSVLLAVLPFWLIGITGSLLLSANGVPFLEWVAPAVAVLLIGLFCRSEALFTFTRWGLLIVAVALCANFLALTGRDYTASPRTTAGISSAVERNAVRSTAERLRTRHAADAVLPEGPVGRLTLASPAREWHTPVTWLYRIERTPGVVWYPGGTVADAAEKLSVRPAGGS